MDSGARGDLPTSTSEGESPFGVRLQVGEVTRAEPFPEAEKPRLANLWVDVGDDVLQSAAQTGYNYEPADLVGRQVLCATTLGTLTVAGFESEALTVGVPDEDGHPVLVRPDEHVPLGGRLHRGGAGAPEPPLPARSFPSSPVRGTRRLSAERRPG
jgi:tRNA-binding protein